MRKAPNLLLRSLVATGALVALAAVRYRQAVSTTDVSRPSPVDLIGLVVVLAAGGVLVGLLLHHLWPRTRSRAAGALVGFVVAAAFLLLLALALHPLPGLTPLELGGAVVAGGVLLGMPLGAWFWPPYHLEHRLSKADLIVGREREPGARW